jgi:plastocyanin
LKTPILSRSIIVTPCTRRWTLIALVVALLASGCGSSNSATSPTGPCTPTPTNPECVNPPNLLTVTIKNGVYSPNPVSVKVGQSVNWLNSDSIAHTATDPGVFDTGSIAPTSAADVPVPFNTPGTYNYHCTLHTNESATIVVTQ